MYIKELFPFTPVANRHLGNMVHRLCDNPGNNVFVYPVTSWDPSVQLSQAIPNGSYSEGRT